MKKFLPYILILIVLVGLLSPLAQVQAVDTLGTCTFTISTGPGKSTEMRQTTTEADCKSKLASTNPNWVFDPAARSETSPMPTSPSPADKDKSALEDQIPSCQIVTGDLDDCLVLLSYYIFYTVPSFLLSLTANFLNVIISVTLSSLLYTSSTFIPDAWRVVRDLSNIFFILILIYIAVKVILGLGGHDVKKMIVQVVIMALLINFSMFLTEIVIDSSNILALIFYNKIAVDVKVGNDATAAERFYVPIADPAKTGISEKDITGGLVSAFDPSKMLSPEFFEKAKTRTQAVPSTMGAAAFIGGGALAGSFIPILGTGVGAGIGAGAYAVKTVIGYFVGSNDVPVPLMLGIILTSGLIMAYAAYAFFITGISFVGRLIELWILIIFSPFAFMSSALPILSGIPGVGWKEWLKRLLEVSFMAPIFMFLLYLIFKIIQLNIFGSLAARSFDQQGTLEAIVLLIIPAMVVLILLMKATSYAKKGSGALGAALIKGTEIAMGVAGGVALGGTAVALQASLGKYSSRFADSETAKRWEREGRFGAGALRSAAKYGASSSFDLRKGVIGGVLKTAGGVSGINLGATSKILTKDGGYEADRKKAVEKRQKRAKELEVTEDEPLKQHLNELEDQKQGLLMDVSHDIEQLDNRIKIWRERATDARRASAGGLENEPSGIFDAAGNNMTNDQLQEASENNIIDLRAHRNAIKNGVDFTPTAVSAINPADAGVLQDYSNRTRVMYEGEMRSINDFEDNLIPHAHHEIESENRRRKWAYAERIPGGRIRRALRAVGMQAAGENRESIREAQHKIRMEAKIEDKGGGGGHH